MDVQGSVCKLLLTERRFGFGREICLFEDSVRSQIDREIVGLSTQSYVASYGIKGFHLPRSDLAKIKDGNGIYLKTTN